MTSEAKPTRRRKPAEIARLAAEQLGELAGVVPERIVALERAEHGWQARFEVLEVRRIPDTMDIMAVYEVDLDRAGSIESYRRAERYQRGRATDLP